MADPTFDERFTGDTPEPTPTFESEAQKAAQSIKSGNYITALSEGASAMVAGIPEGIASLFTMAKQAREKGLTPSQEVEFGVNAALTQLGSGEEFKMPPRTATAFDQFHEQVVKPVATNMASPPSQPEPVRSAITIPLDPRNVTRSRLALTGEPHVDAVLNSPVTRDVIDNAVIDRSHDVPYTAGGSNPLNNRTTFIDRHFPRAFNVDGVTFDPAEPFAIHENVEQHTMEILKGGGMDDQTAYKVAHFEFAEKAEGAWYQAHGIDQAKAEAAYKPYLDAIQREPGTRYPPNLFRDPYPHDSPFAARDEALGEPRPTPAEIDRAKAIIADWQKKPLDEQTQPLPLPKVNPLQEAHELGVIGQNERPDLTALPSKEAGRAAMAATAKPGEKVTQDVDERSPWRRRFERTLDKMQTPSDARRVIGAIVDKNDEFRAARQGDLSPAQVEQLSLVAGLDSTKVDVKATSAKIKTDAEVRNTIEAFTSLNAKIKEAADAVRAKNGLDDDAEVSELERLELQHDLLLDATTSTKEFVALRAEFGRIGNTIQDYMKATADANDLNKFRRERLGSSKDDVRDRARMIADTDDRALPRALNPNNRAKATPWFFYFWQNALISGLITHTKYAVVNTAQTVIDRVIAPEVAAVIDRARGNKDVSLRAPVWAYASIVHAFPDALRGAGEAFKTGERVPLISEMELAERGKESPEKGAQPTPYQTSNKVDWGMWKHVFNDEQLAKAAKVIGMPGRSANALHTFYKILNERASLGSRAFDEAFAEKPANNANFWQRYEYHYANPTDETLRGATADGYSGTFMEKLGPQTQHLASTLKGNPITRWLFPFMHIPLNIAKSAIEYSPMALGAFGTEMRDNFLGRNGQSAQSLALAKVVVGTAAMSYFATRALNGELTGSYPINQKERARWRELNIQPNSIVADGQYHSVERLGPPGILIGLTADLVHIWQHYDVEADGADKAITKAIAGLGVAFANSIADDVGFQSIRNIIDFLDGQQKPERFLSYEASTLAIPSLVRQAASADDPYMREAGSLIDGLKYALPWAREGLRPKRDPLYGEPLPNSGYATFGRSAPVTKDIGKSELDRIGYYPAAPADHIGGVKLSEQQYDKYQATAGPLVKAALNGLVNSPQWQGHRNNPEWQKAVAKSVIAQARRKAAGALQMDDHSTIEAGRQRRLLQINGR